ncbi:MAG: cell division protein FtsL [Kofleriaceae bacterium]
MLPTTTSSRPTPTPRIITEPRWPNLPPSPARRALGTAPPVDVRVASPRTAALGRLWRRRALPPAQVRTLVLVMLAATALVLGLGIARVARRHEVVGLGYDLTRASAQVREARELGRRLELERATLTAPARIRALATRLGMHAAAPDQIRVVPAAVGEVAR